MPDETKQDIYEQLARLFQAIDDVKEGVDKIDSWTRTRPCDVHNDRINKIEERLDQLSARRPPSNEHLPSRAPTGAGYQAIKDMVENTERHVLAEVERTAERTVEERIAALEVTKARQKEERRGDIRWWLETAKLVLAILAGAGIYGVARCELPKAARRPTAAITAPARDASYQPLATTPRQPLARP